MIVLYDIGYFRPRSLRIKFTDATEDVHLDSALRIALNHCLFLTHPSMEFNSERLMPSQCSAMILQEVLESAPTMSGHPPLTINRTMSDIV